MAGYTRQDTVNNIADGNIINASDFDNEYDAIEAAFSAVSGHTHDGTAAEGAAITKVGPNQEIVVGISSVLPQADNTLDLGSSSFEFKDLYIDGIANIDSLVADTVDINAGTIDGASIGAVSASTGAFTTLSASGTTTLSALTASRAVFTNASKELVSNAITGTGNVVMSTSPTLTTPVLGVASATSINKVTITAPATAATLTLANNASLITAGGHSLTLTTTGTTNVTFPTSGTLATTAGTVASISFGSTGLTPNTATTGAVTVAGTLSPANGGTGVNNSTRTLTISSNSGTLNFTAASKTLGIANSISIAGTDATTMTFPSTSATVARTDAAQTFTGTQTFSGDVTINGNTSLGNATSDTVSATGRFNTDLVPSTDNVRDLGTSALKWKQIYATTFTENGVSVVSQADIGTAPNEVPLNQYLGTMAFQDADAVSVGFIRSNATTGSGYALGAGSTVTQATSRTTGVTINAACGAITLVSAAGTTTPASFTVTNSSVAATDVIILSQKSGTDKQVLLVTAVAAGSFEITVYTTGGTTTEQPVINFAVIKAVAA